MRKLRLTGVCNLPQVTWPGRKWQCLASSPACLRPKGPPGTLPSDFLFFCRRKVCPDSSPHPAGPSPPPQASARLVVPLSPLLVPASGVRPLGYEKQPFGTFLVETGVGGIWGEPSETYHTRRDVGPIVNLSRDCGHPEIAHCD